MNQLFGEEQAPRLRDRDRRSAEVLVKEPTQLTCSHPYAGSQGLDSALLSIKKAFGDQRQCAGDGIRGAAPTCQVGRDLGTAAKACTKAALLGGSRARKESAVLPLGRACRTDRTAVDPGGRDADEQAPIKTRIARLECSVADIRVELVHTLYYALSIGQVLAVFGRDHDKGWILYLIL